MAARLRRARGVGPVAGGTIRGMSDCLFCRIAVGEIPAQILHATDRVLAFRDINPAAPTHILVIPRHHGVTGPADLTDADAGWVGRMLVIASRIAGRTVSTDMTAA